MLKESPKATHKRLAPMDYNLRLKMRPFYKVLVIPKLLLFLIYRCYHPKTLKLFHKLRFSFFVLFGHAISHQVIIFLGLTLGRSVNYGCSTSGMILERGLRVPSGTEYKETMDLYRNTQVYTFLLSQNWFYVGQPSTGSGSTEQHYWWFYNL